MSEPVLLNERRDGYAVLTLNRPDRLNAFTAELHDALREALDGIERSGDCRAAALTGAGRGFCAGQDLAILSPPRHSAPSFSRSGRVRNRPFSRPFRGVFESHSSAPERRTPLSPGSMNHAPPCPWIRQSRSLYRAARPSAHGGLRRRFAKRYGAPAAPSVGQNGSQGLEIATGGGDPAGGGRVPEASAARPLRASYRRPGPSAAAAATLPSGSPASASRTSSSQASAPPSRSLGMISRPRTRFTFPAAPSER